MRSKMENIFKTVIGISGGAISYLIGGWTALLGVLLAFVIIDYGTGVAAGAAEGNLSSEIGFRGIFKKVCIFVVIAVAHLVDIALGQGNFFRDAAVFFYIANELISITENIGEIGLPLPPGVSRAIKILQQKGDNDEK